MTIRRKTCCWWPNEQSDSEIAMKLETVLKGVDVLSISGVKDSDIAGVSYDSRRVSPGNLFIAVRGEKSDGNRFIADAVAKGAAAIVYDHSESAGVQTAGDMKMPEGFTGAFIRVRESRKALAQISNNFFGCPSASLDVVGVTGTNGKTTTTYIIKSILEARGEKVGLIGTIQYMVGDEVFDAVHTTPEALEFQGLLHRMLEAGCRYVVSEVSSHAIAQKRVDGTAFRTAVFTNLTREHLDFHETMEAYFFAKARLFCELLNEKSYAVINHDDPWGQRLCSLLKGNVITYGLEQGADLMAVDIESSFGGLQFNIVSEGEKYRCVSSLTGLPNVYNILSAAGAAVTLGVPWSVVLEGIRKAGTVKGRFEKIDLGQGFLAVVDYAHTEDALERLIYTAKGLTKGKIITVFGCGGDRDRGKRPKMGAIATKLSDLVVITSDNPRTEDPADIITGIEAGTVRKNYLIEPDRREAIKRAVMMASEGDIVLIAGKGHETYQEIGGRRYNFSDREVLEDAIRQMINNT